MTISGIFRVINKSLLKYSKALDVHWLVVLLIGAIVKIAQSSVIFMIVALLSNINTAWYNWYDKNENSYSNRTCGIITVLIISLLFVETGYTVFNIKGYQIGNLGRLGLIANGDLIIAYLLQIWVLNENNNYITYIGVFIAIVAITILFYEQWQLNQPQQQQTYQEIATVDSDEMDENGHNDNNFNEREQTKFEMI